MPEKWGVVLIFVGLAIAGIGLLAWAGALSWFGRLPGDVRVERGDVKVFVPITSMLLLSVAVSALLALARRFLP